MPVRGRTRAVTHHQRELLASGWQFCAVVADSITHPDALNDASLPWRDTQVPATVATSLAAATDWNLHSAGCPRFDAEDWWYRCRFPAPRVSEDTMTILGFDGLATVTEVWLNGHALLSSDNMFVAHELRVDALLRADNELVLRFKSLDKQLAAKRPRPRWRAPMLENQQLRWFRTTLLGRTPGWSPPAPAVGPWQPIWLEIRRNLHLENTTLRASVRQERGIVEFDSQVAALGGATIDGAQLVLERNGKSFQGALHFDLASGQLRGSTTVDQPELWWPHTHGEPALYSARALITVRRGSEQSVCEIQLGQLGFRTVSLDTAHGNFALSVNGVRVFCRGACWTPLDILSLRAAPDEYRTALQQVRSAGMNMLRVGGTMVYEDDEFLEQCNTLGILVWQDLMFANMDYPDQDAAFIASVRTEVGQQLARWSAHPCLAVLCGNSEVEQQAAMWGAPRERWSPALFHEELPRLVQQQAPDLPYWPSSAHGGAFPHQVNAGTTSYYGVGAYLRPLSDARCSELKFATECLAFANVPEDSMLARMPKGLGLRVHHPEWKARCPRDLGAGWDFDDVRDHYLLQVFGVDPVKLRYADHDRYLQLGRIACGEVMAASFAEWRRQRSTCHGALVWFLRDLWPGAGWGIVDSAGAPKAPFYYLRRTLQPVGLAISDEGNNGLVLHIANDQPTALCATVKLSLYRAGEIVVAQSARAIQVLAHQTIELPAAELFEGFLDTSYAFRFGPASHDLAVAQLSQDGATLLSQACYFPAGLAAGGKADLGLSARATPLADGTYRLVLRTRRSAEAVTVQADGYDCDDQYFHLAPGQERELLLRPVTQGPRRAMRGTVNAINASAATTIELSS